MFNEVPSQFDFPKAEHEILAFWEKHNIYEKSLEKSKGGKPFIFFEGPPTANGLPHPGHCLTRAIKDLFPRYKTMTGHYCTRKGGWDTHGLPVEVEVCKELGIHTKEEIEAYGVEAFNRKCLESVFRYTKEWEDMTRRLGFWINLGEAYVTYHQSYIESVWWALKTLFDAGLLYQGYKIVWWWAQGGTALSAGEVGQGYREVADPSVFVRFPIVMDDAAKAKEIPPGASLLVWTTTPWTLPSNMFAAVHNDFDYAVVHDKIDHERLIFAKELVPGIAQKLKATDRWEIERTFKGSELIGLRYNPPFPECYYDKPCSFGAPIPGAPPNVRRGTVTSQESYGNTKLVLATLNVGADGSVSKHWDQATHRTEYLAWRVLHADFVTLDAGTGIVHQAPAFGEVDFDLWKQESDRFVNGLPLFCSVAPNGTFTDDCPTYKGRWVKDCDKDIVQDMKNRKVLALTEQYIHDYPFCWRADEDPLIQYPRKSWFIRTTQFKDDMLANNQEINWLPEHIKAGRFGKFLESNVDWALSRERYWGTPLPIWVCQDDKCGYKEAVDSYASLTAKPGVEGLDVWEKAKAKDPTLSEHLKIHKPYIDGITYTCPKCGAARMQRVPDVIDCWFDSGAMPFAQWGFPHKNQEMFASQFPADFISEALDQTRGWFYSLVAISTMLFGPNSPLRQSFDAQQEVRRIAHDNLFPLMSKLVETSQISEQVREQKHADLQKLMQSMPGVDPVDEFAAQTKFPHPFRNCIVLGLLMGEDGLKMSKSKKNYREPSYVFDDQGADAMRWLFFSGQTPWTSIRFQQSTIAEGQREFLIRLYNCYSFFVIYANIDKWEPNQWLRASCAKIPTSEGGCRRDCGAFTELDRWIISELNQCCASVYKHMEAYDNYNACKALIQFVDALSNWYVRRSRDRFWRSGMDDNKQAAYATLHECLVTLSKLIAPFTPFLAESIYQNLVCTHDPRATPSVHLCDYPITAANQAEIEGRIDRDLNTHVEDVRQLVSCGRAARSAAKIRVRQPLARIELHHRKADVIRQYEDIIKDELNVKGIDYVESSTIDDFVQYELKPDFRKIGPKHGSLAPKIKAALAKHADVQSLVKALEQDGECVIEIDTQRVRLNAGELAVELHAKEGWTAERIPGAGILVLDTHLTPELRDEGTARDLVNQVQQIRKQLNLRYEQRIDLAIAGPDDIQRVINGFGPHIMGETLAQSLLSQKIPGIAPVTAEIEGHPIEIYVKPL